MRMGRKYEGGVNISGPSKPGIYSFMCILGNFGKLELNEDVISPVDDVCSPLFPDNQMSHLISRKSSLTSCMTTLNKDPSFPSSPSLSTWGLCAPSFALLLLLLLPLFALVLGQLQQVLGDLVVGFTGLQWGVGRWQGERIEALPFVLGPLGLQLRLGGGGRGRGEFKWVQLQRTGAASELELIWCCGGRALQGK